jgi:polysaccharide export outer membrane protein
MTPTKIREKAVNAGWPEASVDEALAANGDQPSPMVTSSAAKVPAEREINKEMPSATSPAPAANPPASDDPASKTAADPSATSKPGASNEATATVRPSVPADATATPAAALPAGAAGNTIPKPPGALGRDDDYLIGEGDVLQVSVYGEPTASVPAATVRPDGKISIPLVKDVLVAGLTPAKVESSIQEQLAKSIRAPDVTVIVSQINSKKIFLTGAVKREGPLKYTYRMTVLQAISEAGGLTDYAKRKKIYILHNDNGRQFRLPFDYTAVLKGEHMEQNIVLAPGDTIVVP